jgi:hypothetical protein
MSDLTWLRTKNIRPEEEQRFYKRNKRSTEFTVSVPWEVSATGLAAGAGAGAGSALSSNTSQAPQADFRNITFLRVSRMWKERGLVAAPITITGKDWKMFNRRGHGLHATSMLTRVVAILGRYIVDTERKYNIYPNEEDGLNKLKIENPIRYKKYQHLLALQEQLTSEKMYQAERNVNPNNLLAVETFKTMLLEILNEQRWNSADIAAATANGPGSASHIFADAEAAVRSFNFPVDSATEDGTRRRQLTKQDQLLVESDQSYVYDSSVDGFGTVFSRGFSANDRDRFAFCVSRMEGFPKAERESFRKQVSYLAPTEGIVRGDPLWRQRFGKTSPYSEKADFEIDTGHAHKALEKAYEEFSKKTVKFNRAELAVKITDFEGRKFSLRRLTGVSNKDLDHRQNVMVLFLQLKTMPADEFNQLTS